MHPLFLYTARKPEFLSQNPPSRTISPPQKKPPNSKQRELLRRKKSFRAHTNATPSLRGRSFTRQRTKRETERGQLLRVLGQGPFPKGLPVSHWTSFWPPFDNSHWLSHEAMSAISRSTATQMDDNLSRSFTLNQLLAAI